MSDASPRYEHKFVLDALEALRVDEIVRRHPMAFAPAFPQRCV